MDRVKRCALILLLWCLFPCGASACSCSWMVAQTADDGRRVASRGEWLSQVDPSRYLESSDTVFLGTVVSSKRLPAPKPWPENTTVLLSQSMAVLEVERVWKGRPMASVSVFTGFLGGGCGFPFAERKLYVVFAQPVPPYEVDWLREIPGALYTTICTLTAQADQVEDWLSILDEATEEWKPYWLTGQE